MIFEELINHVNNLQADKQYWFVRTDSGLYFDTYTKHDFIGIGWNQITVEDLHKRSEVEIKTKIAQSEGYDLGITKGKGKVSAIYNKLKRFDSLAKGDIVIIPSASSSRYAFGVIEDSTIYVDSKETNDCSYHKRRKVKWLAIKQVSSLDPVFYQIKVSRHAISNIKRFEKYIDNVTDHLYIKEGYGHFVLDIKTQDDINVKALLTLIESLQELAKQINIEFNLNENIDSSSIRLNLQSPGKIEFKLHSGKTLIILAAVLSIASGCTLNSDQISTADNHKLEKFVTIHQDTIQQAEQGIDELKVDRDKINAFK
ncbi:hypothetical protein C8P68_1125 [Mucilaginibacter yixingensis]|uniref:Uncharacterized protein n=1 Tax=Mucilaginibacter yixingensis TaxID=1295612 RepID=A0A2T5J4H1_9SPHI|nr:hypothetical protein [Mucilaginibacter yixingensis]PTQ92405.1 hypothetical protein C8P68_1125 [Mucilaginibacter yixingensis]